MDGNVAPIITGAAGLFKAGDGGVHRCRIPRMRRRCMASVAALVLCGVAADAHHSISSVYDSSRPVTLDGLVAEFQLINPHPFLIITVNSGTGAQQWRGEMDNRYELAEIGVTAATFRPGERVVVKGSLGRTEPRSVYILRLDRPADGFWYEQVGQSPKIRQK